MPTTPFADLPLADPDVAWDAAESEMRRRRWASSDGSGDKDKIDWDKYAKGFFYRRSADAASFGDFKLPFADVVDGRLYAIRGGVHAAAAAVQGARGGVDIPDDEMPGVKNHIARYYEKMDEIPPWEQERMLAQKLATRQYRSVAGVSPAGEGVVKLFPDSDYEVQGYFAVWNRPYPLVGDYYEQIDRHALDEADMSDVIMQYDHAGKVLARRSNGTLVIRLDDHGAFIAADLSRSRAARELYEEIAAGLITKMSWGFTIADDEFDRDSRTFTIKKVKKVYDVSAVSIPANDATEISARCRVDGAIEAERRRDRARKHKMLKLKTYV